MNEAASEIELIALTACEAAPGGSGGRMNVIDADANPASVIAPTDCLRSLERGGDGSTILFTIETGDRLQISFALSENDLVGLADAISTREAEAFSPQLRRH